MQHLLERGKNQGLLFVVSAPAGTGKTTLVRRLIEEFPLMTPGISYTTRKPRKGEVPGVHYHFVTEKEFAERASRGEFLEAVELYGVRYGTSWSSLQRQQEGGRHVILVIDTQGALQIRGQLPAIFIFICPPSLDALKERLIGRKTEAPEMIDRRLAVAEAELKAGWQYDYWVVNDDLETAYQVFRSIFIAESHRLREGSPT